VPHRFHIGSCAAIAAAAASLVAAAVVVMPRAAAGPASIHAAADLAAGRDEREPVSHRPTVEAAFAAESYRPGATAQIRLFDAAPRLRIQIFRVGDHHGKLVRRDVMRGEPVGQAVTVGHVSEGQVLKVHLGHWPSSFYYAELTAPAGRVGYAPFVLRPASLGTQRIAVVLPTRTWQAYNFSDDDGDGSADSWYADAYRTTVRLYRPFENRGTPPHYHLYDEPFLRWLAREHVGFDVLSDADLEPADGDTLARAYDVLVFPGHHEYVTARELDAVTRFRDRGGNLMFLSANNLYWKITIRGGGVMTRVAHWRDVGRPEAALVGVGYYWNDFGEHRGPWRVRSSRAGRWIFGGTGLRPGDAFSSGGIEADAVGSDSPPNVQVLAEIVNLFGDGRNAQMTYYDTRAGAKVFAAGAFCLACSIWQPPVRRIVTNLLDALAPAARRETRRP
jgi:N,N-dimethylformamidase beta subunit-like, C-terminal